MRVFPISLFSNDCEYDVLTLAVDFAVNAIVFVGVPAAISTIAFVGANAIFQSLTLPVDEAFLGVDWAWARSVAKVSASLGGLVGGIALAAVVIFQVAMAALEALRRSETSTPGEREFQQMARRFYAPLFPPSATS